MQLLLQQESNEGRLCKKQVVFLVSDSQRLLSCSHKQSLSMCTCKHGRRTAKGGKSKAGPATKLLLPPLVTAALAEDSGQETSE